jgi:hypothetical protein
VERRGRGVSDATPFIYTVNNLRSINLLFSSTFCIERKIVQVAASPHPKLIRNTTPNCKVHKMYNEAHFIDRVEITPPHGITKRCHLFGLTKGALVYEHW